MIPLVTPPTSESPVISPHTGLPMYPINIDRSVQSWLADPAYSIDAFLQAGGRQAVAKLMRENAEIPGRFGIPAGISLYREFLDHRRALTEAERLHVRELWENNKTEKDPHFGNIEDYMLSSASIFEKLSVLSSINRISDELLLDRRSRNLNAQLAVEQKRHDSAIRQPFEESARRAHGAQGKIQSKYDKLEKDYNVLLAKCKKLENENVRLLIENNRLKAEAETALASR